MNIPEGIECYGRNGWFFLCDSDVCAYKRSDGSIRAFVGLYSKRRGKSAPVTVVGNASHLAKLFRDIADNLDDGIKAQKEAA